MRLNLGCGDRVLPNFTNCDIVPINGEVVPVDLSVAPWPWPDSSVSEVFAADILEHLPDKRQSMNELWRVLQPGGKAVVEVPSVRGAGAFCDPTHRSYWSASDFEYYEKGNYARERFRNSYGIKADFKILSLEQKRYATPYDEIWKVCVVLEAVK